MQRKPSGSARATHEDRTLGPAGRFGYTPDFSAQT